MRHVLRSTAAILVALLTAGSMSLATASAAPGATTRCRGPQYPNGQCKIYFDHGHYHRGATANFYTDRAFKPGETVRGKLVCQKNFVVRHLGPWTARSRGRVRGDIIVPKKAPFGTCQLTLTGKTTGAKASGTFKVVRRT